MPSLASWGCPGHMGPNPGGLNYHELAQATLHLKTLQLKVGIPLPATDEACYQLAEPVRASELGTLNQS